MIPPEPTMNRINDPLEAREVETWVWQFDALGNRAKVPVKFLMRAPRTYWRATPAELEMHCNGAGPKGAGWAVPDTIYGLCVTPPANVHDWMYTFWLSRREADDLFLENMQSAIRACGGFMKPVRFARAWMYYQAVHLGGAAFK